MFVAFGGCFRNDEAAELVGEVIAGSEVMVAERTRDRGNVGETVGSGMAPTWVVGDTRKDCHLAEDCSLPEASPGIFPFDLVSSHLGDTLSSGFGQQRFADEELESNPEQP